MVIVNLNKYQILENRGWSAEAKRRFWPKHSWKALMDCYRHSR